MIWDGKILIERPKYRLLHLKFYFSIFILFSSFSCIDWYISSRHIFCIPKISKFKQILDINVVNNIE